MMELIEGNVLRRTEDLAWFEPVEPLGGSGRLVMTTRLGGISQPPYDSLNLGFHVNDLEERVRANRAALRRALAPRLREPVLGHQVHGCRVGAVGELHAGANWEVLEASLPATDGLVTGSRRLPLVIQVADCLPVALIDPVRNVAAAVHAGWRGLADGILEETLRVMSQTWGTLASDTVGWLGPAIGPCCYEVGPEVAGRFPEAAAPARDDRSRLDLRAEASRRLRSAGVVEENLSGLALCTACRGDLFFSHRRATQAGHAATGRMAMLVWLEPIGRPEARPAL